MNMLAILLLTDLYIPIHHDATRVRVTAPGDGETVVASCSERTRPIALHAGTNEIPAMCDGGVMRIGDNDRVDVTAVDQTDSAVASIPVFDSRNAVSEGKVPALLANDDWTRRIGFVNPNDTVAMVSYGPRAFPIPPQGMLVLPMFATSFTSTQAVIPFRVDTHKQSGARVITTATGIPIKRRAVQFPSTVVTNPTPHTVTLSPSKDNTLYISDGSVSNGSGIHFFAGTTAGGSVRRALVAFDVGSRIPPGSTITAVKLTMHVSQTRATVQQIRLNAVTKDWGEGVSNAGEIRDGGGTVSRPGDATWVHTFFPDSRWTNAGGDFNATADASASAGSNDVTWATNAALVTRVQSWVDQPANNFGWILIGNEATLPTAKSIYSREAPAELRPALTIDYTTH